MGRRRSEPDRALERSLDELYSASPDEFVATRKRLAKELRDSGTAETVKTVQEARKPTVAAWAVNRLMRDFPEEARDLLQAGEALRTAQAGIIQGGDPGALQERLQESRDLIARLTRAARQLLGDEGRASETTLARVSETLMASLLDESRAEQLAQARLTKELEPSGFFLPAGVTPAPRGRRRAAKRAERTSVEPKAETRAGGAERRRRVSQAREELKQARADLAEKRKLLAGAEAEEREAAARAERATRDAQAAREAVERAARSVDEAEDNLARAQEA